MTANKDYIFRKTKKQKNATIDWSFSRQDDDDELQSRISVLEVPEHGLHTVRSLGIFTETWLALNRHACILGDFTQLIRKIPERKPE